MWHPKKCLCVSLRDPQYRDVKTFSSDDKCEIPPESTTNEPENTSPEIPEDDKEAFLYIIAATIIILVIATILILIVYFKMLQKLPGFLKKEEVET